MMLNPLEVEAWQEATSSELSDSPIQSKRALSRQSQAEQQLTAGGDGNAANTGDQLLAPKLVDQVPSSERAVTTGEIFNEGGSGVLHEAFNDDAQLQLPRTVDVPLRETPLPIRAVVQANSGLITLVVREASLGAVLNALAEEMNLNIVAAGAVTGQISITLNSVPLDDALDAILNVNGYRWVKDKDIIMVSSITGGAELSPRVQGREVRVFRLNLHRPKTSIPRCRGCFRRSEIPL
ncbi:MAG: hypothetical protein P8J37_05840 [Fuerstiella sp.]|nr:hypothetical protein [Fuerstiella sp.]